MIVVPGTDYLSTQYDDLDLQAAGLSEPITPSAFEFPDLGVVEFTGQPIGPGNTDTIRKRLQPAHLPYPGASDTIEIEWTAVSIDSKNPVTVAGNQYRVEVRLTDGKRSLGKMQIIRSDVPADSGGTFYASVLVLFTATFVNISDENDTFSMDDQVVMSTNQAGIWGASPHRDQVRLISSDEVEPGDANLHTNLAPDMSDFFQLGGVFEGQPLRGGMVTSASG